MTRRVRNTQLRDQFTNDEVFFILPVTANLFSVTKNIFSFTGKISCDTRCSFPLLWQEINFLWQEIFFLSQEKILLWKILYSFLHKKYYSCETKKLFFPVTQGVLPVTGFGPPIAMNIHPMCTNSTFPVTRTIFLVRENSFVRGGVKIENRENLGQCPN